MLVCPDGFQQSEKYFHKQTQFADLNLFSIDDSFAVFLFISQRGHYCW